MTRRISPEEVMKGLGADSTISLKGEGDGIHVAYRDNTKIIPLISKKEAEKQNLHNIPPEVKTASGGFLFIKSFVKIDYMTKSRLSKSIRKYIAKEKARMRREGLAKEEINQKIKEWIELRMKKPEKVEKAEDKKTKASKQTKKPAKSAPDKTK